MNTFQIKITKITGVRVKLITGVRVKLNRWGLRNY